MATIKTVNSFPDFKIQLVTSFPDICVYLTDRESDAKGSGTIWYFTNAFPDKKIQLVDSFPDLKVQYVKSKFEAGWKNSSHKLRNKIG